MDTVMSFEQACLLKFFVTYNADKQLFLVRNGVLFKLIRVRECLATYSTYMNFILCVYGGMFPKVARLCETFLTDVAHIWFLTHMGFSGSSTWRTPHTYGFALMCTRKWTSK
jgi:hypothetical protein